jgi:hypothetical protein
MKFENFSPVGPKRDQHWENFQESLANVAKWIDANWPGSSYIMGDQISYADMTVVSHELHEPCSRTLEFWKVCHAHTLPGSAEDVLRCSFAWFPNPDLTFTPKSAAGYQMRLTSAVCCYEFL